MTANQIDEPSHREPAEHIHGNLPSSYRPWGSLNTNSGRDPLNMLMSAPALVQSSPPSITCSGLWTLEMVGRE